jgi:adenosylcobinamide-phosphate synthase
MFAGLTATTLALTVGLGVLLDLLLGEARRWHPLVGFGRLASLLERHANRGRRRIARGILAWTSATLPPAAIAAWAIGQLPGTVLPLLAHALLLYFCIGLRSLRDHALPIAAALKKGKLAEARRFTGRIVSRDTVHAGPGDLAKAAAESLLENGNDAVFGTLFWFMLAGGPGALLFRLTNTLDAMWGYRSPRYLLFGRCAARIDDVLNWLPARLTALSYVLLGASLADKRRAWRCWRTQAACWPSSNAGLVMASGAGALGLLLGGTAVYDGRLEKRPPLGCGRAPAQPDIARAWRLVAATTALWLGVILLAGYLGYWRNAHA